MAVIPVGAAGIGRVSGIVVGDGLRMDNLAAIPVMVIAIRSLLIIMRLIGDADVIHAPRTAIRRENIVIVENGDIVMRITGQPIVAQPVIESAGVGGAGSGRRARIIHGIFAFSHGWCGDDNEQFILACGKVSKQTVVDSFGIANAVFPIVGGIVRRVVWAAIKIGVRKTGFELSNAFGFGGHNTSVVIKKFVQ